MVPTANLKTLLNHYSSKKNSPLVFFSEFCSYVNRYAQKYASEQKELLQYIDNPINAVNKNLLPYLQEKSILIVNDGTDKKAIIVIQYFIEKFTKDYEAINTNTSQPFPTVNNLPKYATNEVFEKCEVLEYVENTIKNKNSKTQHLYGVSVGQDLPIVLIPSTVKIELLIDICLAKMRAMLRKEEYHDYFLKKLRVSNPGKEISVKTFFESFVSKPLSSADTLKNTGENFYFWGQLCHFIRQDYSKVKDLTYEDVCILQSVAIIEVVVSFYRSKTQASQKKTDALKMLEQNLLKPPYYFSMNDIVKFTDTKGIPLLGQYSQEDLNSYLHEKTTTLEASNLPQILVFKTVSGITYFIMKVKVFSLILKLSNESHDAIFENIKEDWMRRLKNFEHVPEIKDKKLFEEKLEKNLLDLKPVLYALLNSNFLSLINYETQLNSDAPNRINLFANGKLLPYSDILMIQSEEIFSEVKIMLPFWYTSPFISKIVALMFGKRRAKSKAKTDKADSQASFEVDDDDIEISAPQKKENPKESLKNLVHQIEEELIPQNSSLQKELKIYCNRWNIQIGKDERNHLTEDVNCLIRDSLRKVLRTIKNCPLTMDRIENLSEQIVSTPSLDPIRDKNALQIYTKLYILHLIKNIK